ncbi:putative amidohydrolase protein [Neofusicoccum parvum UCRNP2]|uniref:Amidohydrolase 1 n=2 Tax=Neofusicoccum parvum TaxID=310453 RepID=A0ACB5RPZ3_9PEZI|nr:putative amidohydrolase protein [Neofusicoccum parvum UCRNP2]GME22593.1 Amidohydrolase 1 [Neofusicoccum parvum]
MTSETLIKPWKLPPQKTYIFKNANLIDPVEGSVLPNTTVKIAGGLIESVSSNASSSSSDITVDLDGKYICPGLIDAHVHVTAVPGEKDLGKCFGMDPTVSLTRQPFVCGQMLRRGFTSIRDCGGASLALKEAIRDGVFPGPRLFIANRALSQTGGHADFRGAHDHSECCGGHITGLGVLCDGVPECIKAAREQLRTGADFIKIMCGGGVASPTDALENTQFTAAEVSAISEVARSYNTWVTAHAYTPQAIRHAVDNGVTGIEHGNFIDEATAKYMADRGVFLTPTLIAYDAMASPRFPGFLPPESESKNQEVLAQGLRALEIASRAGITMCYGSDLLGPLGVEQAKEFGLRRKVLSAKQVLQCATVNPARMLRQERFLGQVKDGFAADMLVLNANPLDDIEVLDRPEKHLLAVIKDGRVYASQWSKLAEDVAAARAVIE